MLNIISRSIVSQHNRGPRKVVLNLIKGLDEIGYPYVVNHALNATDQLWIHDDPTALSEALNLNNETKILVGPNVFTLPAELPIIETTRNILWLHPALWVKNFWETFGTQKLNSAVWPVGVDTDTFKPTNETKDIVLIYNKQRSAEDVKKVCITLNTLGENFEIITYGSYEETDYKKLLNRSKAIIWIGRSESQGIGLEEALSLDVPALIWDIEKFGQWEGSGKEKFTQAQLDFSPVTSAPYFNEECGIKFTKPETLEENLKTFLDKLDSFSPRAYIENNLTLASQAKAFIKIYATDLGVSETELKDQSLRSTRIWQNATLPFRARIWTKDVIRRFIS